MTTTETETNGVPFVVAALYHFTRLERLEAIQAGLAQHLSAAGVKGTILLGQEGVNGTIAGSRGGIDAALGALRALPGCAALRHKESLAEAQPFLRLKVRIKPEIVTMGKPGIDPTRLVGRYVPPDAWNEVIADPDTIVVDTRNDYEVEIGTFQGAVNPKTGTFRDFPAWVEANRDHLTGKRVAMFCTGGIRCEKATSYLLSEGFEEVVHLEGGILKYLETVPAAESRWQGECFVFDGRVSVTHGLGQGSYELCYGCRQPVSAADLFHPDYEAGVCCPRCAPSLDADRRARLKERQKQVRLAAARGEAHIGVPQRRGR